MRAPEFWSNPPEMPGLAARLLSPVSLLWRLGGRVRAARPSWRAPCPVISVGNLTAGGTGKTPLVRALADRLTARGHAPHILSRGYGGRLRGPHRVDPRQDTADDVGDEPLMLAATLPVWIARDRKQAALRAVEEASCLILDDGHQSTALERDLCVVTVDAGAGFGNGRVIPAGPLREPISEGLARADAVILIGPEADRAACLSKWPELATRPVAQAELLPSATGLDLAGQPVVAFAGIGRPEKFFATLAAMGADVRLAEPFPDHHSFPVPVLRRLLRTARSQGAMLVTTEKDAVRLPAEFRREVVVVPVDLRVMDWQGIDVAIQAVFANKSP
ncbi:MAG: tetraacyldisaccharide 4'-kinase [Pseudomonadota bacterium]